MKRISNAIKNAVIKYGHAIAGCAFAFVAIAANSSCMLPYYKPKEPAGLEKFKKFNK